MLEKLAEVESRYLELEALMGDPAIAADYEKVAELAKERASLQDIVDAYRQYQKGAAELEDARELLLADQDAEMRELAGEEIAELASTPKCWRTAADAAAKTPATADVKVEIRAGPRR